MSEQILGTGSRIKHPQFGVGVITQTFPTTYSITFIQHGMMEIPQDTELMVIEAIEGAKDTVSMKDVEKTLLSILKKWGGIQEEVALGNKWVGGTMSLKPDDENLKAKEIPIEVFFHKIVMVRDRLRVMEQRINSSSLKEEEKVNLQQYISRIYGSLTTFNVLFKEKKDHFRSAS